MGPARTEQTQQTHSETGTQGGARTGRPQEAATTTCSPQGLPSHARGSQAWGMAALRMVAVQGSRRTQIPSCAISGKPPALLGLTEGAARSQHVLNFSSRQDLTHPRPGCTGPVGRPLDHTNTVLHPSPEEHLWGKDLRSCLVLRFHHQQSQVLPFGRTESVPSDLPESRALGF